MQRRTYGSSLLHCQHIKWKFCTSHVWNVEPCGQCESGGSRVSLMFLSYCI